MEGLLTLLVLIVIGASAFALAVRAVAQLQLESAVANAAASTLSARLGAGGSAQSYALDAYDGTLAGHVDIDPGTLVCTSAGFFGQGNAQTAYTRITCSADAHVRLDRFPFPVGLSLPIHASASVLQPAYRQCDTVTPSTPSTCR